MKDTKKIQTTLNIIIGSFGGTFIGHALERYMHYRKYPAIYEIHSAPWYTALIIPAIFTLIVILVCIVIKIVLKRKAG